MEPRITVSEEARAMRRASDIRSITDAELRVLTKTTPRVAANEPPDGYAIALNKQRQPQPPTHIDPLDGYAVALDKPRPTVDPLDGYAVAIDKLREEAL